MTNVIAFPKEIKTLPLKKIKTRHTSGQAGIPDKAAAGNLQASIIMEGWLIDAINKKARDNGSSFSHEARRLMRLGLKHDEQENTK